MSSHMPDEQTVCCTRSDLRPLDILIVSSEAPPIVSGISTCIDRLPSGLTAREHRVREISCAQIQRLTARGRRAASLHSPRPRKTPETPELDAADQPQPATPLRD